MFQRLFLDHPRSVDESYAQHMGVSGRIGLLLIAGGLAALVHAVVPGWHKRTGSRMIRRLNAEIQGRVPTQAEVDGDWVI
jgi:hypothetical protein